MVDVCSLMQLASREHLLVVLEQEKRLCHPQMHGRLSIVVGEDLPPEVRGHKIRESSVVLESALGLSFYDRTSSQCQDGEKQEGLTSRSGECRLMNLRSEREC